MSPLKSESLRDRIFVTNRIFGASGTESISIYPVLDSDLESEDIVSRTLGSVAIERALQTSQRLSNPYVEPSRPLGRTF